MKGPVVEHTQKRGPNVVHITRNSFCPRLKEVIAKHPEVELLGILPLPNCDQCKVERKDCPIRYAYETHPSRIDAYCITYSKLLSLMLSRNKQAKKLLEKILSSTNYIFDECHYLQEAESFNVAVWQRSKHGETQLLDDFASRFERLASNSEKMKEAITEIARFLNSLQPKILKLIEKSKEDRHKKHLSLTVTNPAIQEIVELSKAFKTQSERWPKQEPIDIPKLKETQPDFSMPIEYAGSMMEFRGLMAIQKLLMQTITNPRNYGLSVSDIVNLSKLIFIVTANKVTVSYVKSLKAEQVILKAENTVFYSTLKSFIASILKGNTFRRIITTTATFGSFKLETLFENALAGSRLWFENKIWGVGGDPKATCDKALVMADKAKVSPYNFFRRRKQIVRLIEKAVQKYGVSNVQVLTMNKRWAKTLMQDLKTFGFTEEDVTWYGSDKTEGVSSKKRFWITVGLGERPINAKDHLAETQAPYHDNSLGLQGEKFYYYISQKLRKESVHIATYQAISRAKDPEGKDRSLVIAIGTRQKDVEDCISWGINRQLVPRQTGYGLDFDVEVEMPLSKPHVTTAPLTSDIDQTMHIIDQWLSYGKVAEYKLNWVYLKRLVDRFGRVSVRKMTRVTGIEEKKIQAFFNTLPDILASVEGYVLANDEHGNTTSIESALIDKNRLYTKFGSKTYIIYNRAFSTHFAYNRSKWFLRLCGVVDKAPSDLNALTSRFFQKHVGESAYNRLSRFFDALVADPSLLPSWIVIGNKTGTRESRKLIRDCYLLGAWAPRFPRRFGNPYQRWVEGFDSLLELIKESHGDIYTSVYAFPDQKHPMSGGNPPISTIFIDLDVESPEFAELKRRWEAGEKVEEKLRSVRGNLLKETIEEAKALVGYLVNQSITPRILLSGFKGLHIFIDFPPVQFSSKEAAKTLIRQYVENIKAAIDKNIKLNIDTSVLGDLSRLCRIPNTQNSKASKLLGHPQYAVPITVEECLQLTAETYDELCARQRWFLAKRDESSTMLRNLVNLADDLGELPLESSFDYVRDPEEIEKYEAECTIEILNDADFEDLDIRSCFKYVRRERIALDGSQGHMFRIAAARELACTGLSINSSVRWFDFNPDFDPVKTRRKIEELISHGHMNKFPDEYGHLSRRGWKCSTIQSRCPDYCLREKCRFFRRGVL